MVRFQGLAPSRLGCAVAAAAALLLSGCEQIIIDPSVSAEVRGVVVRESGEAVAGVEIVSEALDPTCTAPAEHAPTVVTNAQGHYVFSITTFGASDRPLCLRMEAVPPAGTGLLPLQLPDQPVVLSVEGRVYEIDIVLSGPDGG